MKKCVAPWYELNISAPHNRVSACCYYSAETANWDNATSTPLAEYWNGPEIQKIRKIQTAQSYAGANGCDNCHFYQNQVTESRQEYASLSVGPHQILSDKQKNNLELAKKEFAEGASELLSTPLRYYANFGFFCNLSCKFCIQVPSRKELRNEIITSDQLYEWKESLESALSIDVIGGEPFALPEALKFIRKFSVDKAMESVQLNIYTNGTLLNKHINKLKQKKKLGLYISLDSISAGYDKARLGGTWKHTEQNIKEALKIKNELNPEWRISTNSAIMLSSIPYMAEFASWHVEHNIPTMFYDFINTYGVEDAFFTENVIANPQLLDKQPDWESHFDQAIAIFRAGGSIYPAETLELSKAKIQDALKKLHTQIRMIDPRQTKPGTNIIEARDYESVIGHLALRPKNPDSAHFEKDEKSEFMMINSHSSDKAITNWFDVNPKENSTLTLRVFWEALESIESRLTHIAIQSHNGAYIEGRRFYNDAGNGTELLMTVSLPSNTESIRLNITPTGENGSYLPCRMFLYYDLQKTQASCDCATAAGER